MAALINRANHNLVINIGFIKESLVSRMEKLTIERKFYIDEFFIYKIFTDNGCYVTRYSD